jgi:hypothetical protein
MAGAATYFTMYQHWRISSVAFVKRKKCDTICLPTYYTKSNTFHLGKPDRE